jgi:hypothetical protein
VCPLVEDEAHGKGSPVDTVDLDAHVPRAEQLQDALPFGDFERRIDPRTEASSECGKVEATRSGHGDRPSLLVAASGFP